MATDDEIKYSNEEREEIKKLLSSLNRNPENSEDLDPMAGFFKEKIGAIGANRPVSEEGTGEESNAEEENTDLNLDADEGEQISNSDEAIETIPTMESSETNLEESENKDNETDFDVLDDLLKDDKVSEEESELPSVDDFIENKTEDAPPSEMDIPENEENPVEDLVGHEEPVLDDDPFSVENAEETEQIPESNETNETKATNEEAVLEPENIPNFEDFSVTLDDENNNLEDQTTRDENISEPLETSEIKEDFSEVENLESEMETLGTELAEPEEDLTDEELATIQNQILKYPSNLRRVVIDSISENKISNNNQKKLLELIKSETAPEDIAHFLSDVLNENIQLIEPSGKYTIDGVPIISSKPSYTKEGAIRQRQLIRRTVISAVASIGIVTSIILIYKYLIVPYQAKGYYELGLKKIQETTIETVSTDRKKIYIEAEQYFSRAEKIDPNNLEYLNRYGIAYMKVGEYERSFEKLFGKVKPDFGMEEEDQENSGSWNKREQIPYISLIKGEKWSDKKLPLGGRIVHPDNLMTVTSQDKIKRKIIKAGAYIVSRLKYNVHHEETYLNLGRFHSNFTKFFQDSKYKNDTLAINYYKQIFTDGEDPSNLSANLGIAKIYYNQKELSKAIFYYNKIIEMYPTRPEGHSGLLNTYVEIWKKDKNPIFILNHHRQLKNSLDIENELSMYSLTKLASFYIGLDDENLKIKYNVNPTDQVTGMDIEDTATHLLNVVHNKEEKRDEVVIRGSEFAEAYFQRGKLFLRKKEISLALKQFEFAANYDHAHYLSVLEMAKYYVKVMDFNEAIALLETSLERYKIYNPYLGNREEDETLLEGNPGLIPFYLGKIAYLESAGVLKTDKINEFPGRKIYPNRALAVDEMSKEEIDRRKNIYIAKKYFDEALPSILPDDENYRNLYYYRGWIEYNNNNFAEALMEWSNFSEEDEYGNVNILFAKANAFYYTNQYNASLGNYLKIKDDLEERKANIGIVQPQDVYHQEIFNTLYATYNNMGAIYEKRGETSQALKYYWKSIETARKINITSEIATSNKDLLFKKEQLNKEPLLDDWASPSPDSVRSLL